MKSSRCFGLFSVCCGLGSLCGVIAVSYGLGFAGVVFGRSGSELRCGGVSHIVSE